MEQYLDARVKRYVQKRLFSKIDKTKTILGLAGTHPEKYIEVLPYHKQVILVDFNPVNDSVRRNSLVGEFDLINSQPAHYSPITFVDCDFCKSILSCGDDLLYIYNKMKRSTVKNKYIAFTFSLRGVGLTKTWQWLKENFKELNIQSNVPLSSLDDITNLNLIQKRQYVRQYYDSTGHPINLYGYRDSGACMISGLIKVA